MVKLCFFTQFFRFVLFWILYFHFMPQLCSGGFNNVKQIIFYVTWIYLIMYDFSVLQKLNFEWEIRLYWNLLCIFYYLKQNFMELIVDCALGGFNNVKQIIFYVTWMYLIIYDFLMLQKLNFKWEIRLCIEIYSVFSII